MQNLVTLPTIADGLADLRLSPGTTLLVHASLSSLGRVQGGAQTVLQALTDYLGTDGTIVMPTFTEGRFDPSEWGNPPVPETLWNRIRFETPEYDPSRTPTDNSMSVVYELFRTWPQVSRTNHPHSSFAAWGANRERVTSTHALDERFGNSSPLAKLYDLDAQVLFLGTGYLTNTCFHLAEYRRQRPPTRTYQIVKSVNGTRTLTSYADVDTNSSIFGTIGQAFENQSSVLTTQIGAAQCRSFSLRTAVDFAERWLNQSALD